jgi:hypothetical protein
MPLSFFPAYCGIVLLAAAAVHKFFVVGVSDYVVLLNAGGSPDGQCYCAELA